MQSLYEAWTVHSTVAGFLLRVSQEQVFQETQTDRARFSNDLTSECLLPYSFLQASYYDQQRFKLRGCRLQLLCGKQHVQMRRNGKWPSLEPIYHGDFNLICVYSFICRLAHTMCHRYHGIFKSKMDPEYTYIGTSQKNWDFYQCVDY